MTEEILEETIRQCMSQASCHISFCWQGGEPTLIGLPFFERAVAFQIQYGHGQSVGNSLQTNGFLLDKNWSHFLRKYSFLVGLSLDGPEHVHNRYRLMKGGHGSWKHIVDRAKLLLDEGVEVNALTVVSDYSSQFAQEIYGFHKALGLRYMQFIPCFEKNPGNPQNILPFSVQAKDYGNFLCQIFDLWCSDFRDGRPTISVRFFDSAFFHYVGLEPPECTLLQTCGVYIVVEHNGDAYACDFFVDPEWKLGSVMTDSIEEMLNSSLQNKFSRLKSQRPSDCQICPWLCFCWGGCPKDVVSDKAGKNYQWFCAAYKMFFEHADPFYRKIAAGRKQKHTATSGRVKVRRNDPCPCGSGLKYKKCCGI